MELAGKPHLALTSAMLVNPLVVDEKTWQPTTYQGISIWGHTREGQTIIDKLGQFKTAAASLLHREDTVTALSGAGIPDD
jgi:hypothetical protein